MTIFNSYYLGFIHLVNYLNQFYVNQPMEGQCTPVQANPYIKHPEREGNKQFNWNVLYPDTQALANRRAQVTQTISPPRKLLNGQIIYRTNHGLTHLLRSMAYIPAVVDYYRHHGQEGLRQSAEQLYDTQQLAKLMVAMAFSSISRDSEIHFLDQPGAHQFYRKRAGAIFRYCYQQWLRQGEPALALFNLFLGQHEFERYHDAVVALGNTVNEQPLLTMMNTAHKLDLYRCSTMPTAQATIESYVRCRSQGRYGQAFNRLMDYAIRLLVVTGSPIDAIERDEEAYIFNLLSVSPYQLIDRLNQYPPASMNVWPVHDELNCPFFIKSIQTHDRSIGERFISDVTRSYINQPDSPTRFKPKGHYTLKMVKSDPENNLDILMWRVCDRNNKQPTYSRQAKRFTSNIHSLTYVDPSQAFLTSAWKYAGDNQVYDVGIMAYPNHVLINRMALYDMAFYYRPFEYFDAQTAHRHLQGGLDKGVLVNNLDDIVRSGVTTEHNEVTGRLQQIDKILIFTDNYESRLLAQYLAKLHQKRRIEQSREMGHTHEWIEPTPIIFYQPDQLTPLSIYHHCDQVNDYQQACQMPSLYELTQAISALNGSLSLWERYGLSIGHVLASRGSLVELKQAYEGSQVELEMPDQLQRTPAHWAALNGQLGVLRFLAVQGCALDKTDYAGYTPYDLAQKMKWPKAANFLATNSHYNHQSVNYSAHLQSVCNRYHLFTVNDADGQRIKTFASQNDMGKAPKVDRQI